MGTEKEEWELAARSCRAWSEQATRLAENAGSGIARLAVQDWVMAASLAEAACRAAPENGTRFRQAAATMAESGAVQTKVVLSDLEASLARAQATGAGTASDLMQAEANTWKKAIEVAAVLRRLAGDGSVELPEIGRLLKGVRAREPLLAGEDMTCLACSGEAQTRCPICGGKGRRRRFFVLEGRLCEVCDGTGKVPCAECSGKGVVTARVLSARAAKSHQLLPWALPRAPARARAAKRPGQALPPPWGPPARARGQAPQSASHEPDHVAVADSDGLTPLHIAAASNDIREAQELIRSGARVNAQKNNGATPLHLAAGNNNPQMIRILLQAGADPTLKTTQGHTPLGFARASGGARAALAALEEFGVRS